MKAKRKKSHRIEQSGIRLRLFRKRDSWWIDIRLNGRPRERRSLKTSELQTAEALARLEAKEIARQELIGVTSAGLTLGQVFSAYEHHKGRTLEGQWKRGTQARARFFLAAWGPNQLVSSICQTQVDSYSDQRRSGVVASRARAAALKAKRKVTPLRDGALDSDFRWLSSVFNWARKHKLPSGRRLLDYNPLADTKWPREKNPRQPVASEDRFLKTVAHADAVDPEGRLRLVLTLARETGRRENAILQLRAADILLSRKSIERALAEAGRDEGTARHMPHGAIRWAASSDKMGFLHITPITMRARTAIERYLSRHPRLGDVPLFPGPKVTDAGLSRVLASRWLAEAEKRAELPKLVGGAFHPYRRLWATERKHLADIDVASAGGWKSTKTLAIYQKSDPVAVLAAVVNAGS